MLYLYINKLENKYYIMNSTETYDYSIPSSNYGLICKLEKTYQDLAARAGGIYGRIAEEALELDTLIAGCRASKKEEVNIRTNKILTEYLARINPLELITLNIQAREAEQYISSKGNYHSAILKALASAKSVKVDELALFIRSKSEEHEQNLIRFRYIRDYIESKLQYIDTMEDFESFDIKREISNCAMSLAGKRELGDKDLLYQESVKSIENFESPSEIIEPQYIKNNKKKK